MKVSLRWLRDYVPVTAPAADVASRLTMAGLEVEGVTHLGAGLATVVVAEVLAAEKHPQADKLSIVTITDGAETVKVVCGAPNVPPPGNKVAWAKPGTKLPGGMVVETRPVRGVTSPGMLCAEDELGLGDDHSGIIVFEPGLFSGTSVADFFADDVLEIAVTTNRPDCLGHLGVAREVGALYGLPLTRPIINLTPYLLDHPVTELARLRLEDPAGCPRYTARVVTGLAIAPSPRWLQARLRAVGVRPISNVVDVTNYVLMEYGHPLHAFDRARLAEATIVVRRAREGERMTTLDEQIRQLTPEDVLICDAARPVAVAGVMGGRESEVGAATTEVLLESAMFAPSAIRRTSKRLGLQTEASYRFERGADPNIVDEASARACQMMAELAGGRVARGMLDEYPRPVRPREVPLRLAYARRLLGIDPGEARITELMHAVGVETAPPEAGTIVCRVPTYRPDLTREVDLCEEIVRLHGLGAVPATLHLTARAPTPSGDAVGEAARDALAALGLDEVITMGFTAGRKIAALGFPEGDPRRTPVAVRNPLREDHAVMRTSLLPGLLDVARLNLDRSNTDVRLFEVGTIFVPHAGAPLPDEPRFAAALLSGRRDGWLAPGAPLDFYDAKGVVLALAERLGLDAAADEPAPAPFLHPGQAAVVTVGGQPAGLVGQVHPRTREAFGIEAPCFYLELSLAAAPGLPVRKYRELPRFPAVVRDISFFAPVDLPAAAITRAVAALVEPLRETVRVVEDYRETGKVPAGQKGMLWSITYRAADRTLTDDEVNQAQRRLVAHLQQALGVEPR
jgi:phenylalanyl-tRNA synthetase beta chain